VQHKVRLDRAPTRPASLLVARQMVGADADLHDARLVDAGHAHVLGHLQRDANGRRHRTGQERTEKAGRWPSQQRPDLGSNELRGPVFGHLQDRARQNTVGAPEFIQDREVICVDDRNQVAGEMRPRPVCMVISATCDHRR
jgi:hypothetical protein